MRSFRNDSFLNNRNSFYWGPLQHQALSTTTLTSYSVTNFYNILNQVVTRNDSGGVLVTNFYNNQGLQISSSNTIGQMFLRNYDIRDRVTNNVDGNGVIVTNGYDDLNRVVMRGRPGGGAEGFGYSEFGLKIYTNQLGFTDTYGYDTARRKIAETNALSQTNIFAYDAAGDLTSRPISQ